MSKEIVYLGQRFYPNKTFVCDLKSINKSKVVLSISDEFKPDLKKYYPKNITLLICTKDKEYIATPPAKLVSVEENKSESELLLFVEWEFITDELEVRLNKLL